MEYKEIESLETFLIEVGTSLMDEVNRLLVHSAGGQSVPSLQAP